MALVSACHVIVCCNRICAGFSLTCYQKEVPLLLKDPVSLLIQIILTLPATLETGKQLAVFS